MKHLVKSILIATAAAVALLAPAERAAAQGGIEGLKPVAVVSLAPVDKLMADTTFLLEAAKTEPFAQQIILAMASEFTKGIDTKRPSGAYILLDGLAPSGVAFIPVTDLQTVLQSLEEQIGEPRDAGDGVLEIATGDGQSIYLKEQGGWAFLAIDPTHLAALPADPAAVLGQLPQTYDISVQVNMRNVSPEARDLAISQLRAGLLAPGGDADDDAARKLRANAMESIITMIDQTDQITLGWAVDPTAKNTYLEVRTTAIEGTDLARQMERMKETSSSFSGFLLPDAAVTALIASKMAPQDIERVLAEVSKAREKALTAIDDDSDLPSDQAREAVKGILGQLFDVATKTIEDGSIDAGASLVLKQDAIQFAAGLGVADGKKLDDAVRKLAELAQNEPNFPEVNFDAAQHGDATFHTFSVPLPEHEEEARKLFGPQLDVVVGAGAKSVYIGLGKGSLELIKSAIDKSAADAAKNVPPFQVNLAMTPILDFAASVEGADPMTAALAQAIKEAGDQDRITVSATSINRGVAYRLEVDGGILQMLGQAAKMAGAGPGGGF